MQTLHRYPHIYGWWSAAFAIGGFRYLATYLVNIAGLPATIFLLDSIIISQALFMLAGIMSLFARKTNPYYLAGIAIILIAWSTLASALTHNWLWHDIPVLLFYVGTFISCGLIIFSRVQDETPQPVRLISGSIFILLGIYYLIFIFIKFDSGQYWVILIEQSLLVALGIVFIFSVLNRLQNELRRSATTDMASGAYTRHYFLQRVNSELKRAQRYHRPFSLLIFQLKDFPDIIEMNKKKAELILRAINDDLIGALRDCDFTGLTDEGEFSIALPETDEAEARHVAERQLYLVKNSSLASQLESIKSTIFITATKNEVSDSAESIYNRAKQALLKQESNDKVVFITSSEAMP